MAKFYLNMIRRILIVFRTMLSDAKCFFTFFKMKVKEIIMVHIKTMIMKE